MSDPIEMRKKLGTVSNSFCLAKWLQVTVHLQTGQTHSCHHPGTHKIPLNEIAENPSALHNTNFKKLQRKDMLEGQRPSECDYCWKIEDLPGDQISDRYMKSNENWARPHFDRIRKMPWDQNVNPTYLEVSFSSECNFRCVYCAPHISTIWEKEIEKFGPYQTRWSHNSLDHLKAIGSMPIKEATNPYVDAFWKWLPEIYLDLEHLRVTGGEPLLSESTFRLMDYVDQNPHPNLKLAINSNLGVPTARVDRFIEKAKRLKNLGSFTIFTSVDTYGPQAEYIRTGLKLSLFEKHVTKLLESLPGIEIAIMCTFNALSVENFGELLERVHVWKKLARANGSEFTLDISYLRHPSFLSVEILPQDWLPKFERLLDQARQITDVPMEHELIKLTRLVEYFASLKKPDPANLRDFASFILENDKRRKTDFRKTFPTYVPLLEHALTLEVAQP